MTDEIERQLHHEGARVYRYIVNQRSRSATLGECVDVLDMDAHEVETTWKLLLEAGAAQIDLLRLTIPRPPPVCPCCRSTMKPPGSLMLSGLDMYWSCDRHPDRVYADDEGVEQRDGEES